MTNIKSYIKTIKAWFWIYLKCFAKYKYRKMKYRAM